MLARKLWSHKHTHTHAGLNHACLICSLILLVFHGMVLTRWMEHTDILTHVHIVHRGFPLKEMRHSLMIHEQYILNWLHIRHYVHNYVQSHNCVRQEHFCLSNTDCESTLEMSFFSKPQTEEM